MLNYQLSIASFLLATQICLLLPIVTAAACPHMFPIFRPGQDQSHSEVQVHFINRGKQKVVSFPRMKQL